MRDLGLEGYRCGVWIDPEDGTIARGTVEDVETKLMALIERGGQMAAHWTVEAGCVPEFLRDPWLTGYLEIKAKVAVFCQRKTDAMKIEGELRRRVFRQ